MSHDNHSELFQHTDYCQFLRTLVDDKKIQGGQKGLAEIMNCQPAYLSRVLKSTANLSLEQALALGQFLKLNESQMDFFLALVAVERAGTSHLKDYWQTKIELLRKRNLKESACAAPELGGYTQKQKSEWIGTYRCTRPLFDSPQRFEIYFLHIAWDFDQSCLVFEERRVGHNHSGKILIPNNIFFLYFLTIDSGAVRLMTLSDLNLEIGKDIYSGFVATIANPQPGHFFPSGYKVILEKTEPEEGRPKYVNWQEVELSGVRKYFDPPHGS